MPFEWCYICNEFIDTVLIQNCGKWDKSVEVTHRCMECGFEWSEIV